MAFIGFLEICAHLGAASNAAALCLSSLYGDWLQPIQHPNENQKMLVTMQAGCIHQSGTGWSTRDHCDEWT